MTVQINELSPELYLCLYRSVGWDAPGLDQIKKALEGSLATFCACDGDMPVGMARLMGDGGMSFYIKDFAVLPDYQGQGVGRALMNATESWIKEQLQPGWAVSLELISSKGRESFYEHHGFISRPTSDLGPGMIMFLTDENAK